MCTVLLMIFPCFSAWHVRLKHYYANENIEGSQGVSATNSTKAKNESGSGSEKENSKQSADSHGDSVNNKPPKKAKRKIVSSSDEDDDLDPDFSLKPKVTKKSEKQEKSSWKPDRPEKPEKPEKLEKAAVEKSKSKQQSVKTTTTSTATSSPSKHSSNASKNVVKNIDSSAETIKKILSGEKITEREKLFPRYSNTSGNRSDKQKLATSKVQQKSPVKRSPNSEISTDKTTKLAPLATATNPTPPEMPQTQTQKPKSNIERKIAVSTPTGGNFDILGSIMKDMKK